MYSLKLLLLILFAMSQLLTPIAAYILPLPFHDNLVSDKEGLQGYLSDSQAYERNDFPVILPDLSDERDDGGRILALKCC